MTNIKLIEGLDISPFTRLIWKNNDTAKLWSKRLNMVARLQHAAEYLTVKEGIRPCATLHIDNKSEELIEQITRDGLYWIPIQRVGKYQGFAHYHPPVKDINNSTVYGVLASKLSDAELFKNASRMGNHNIIGQLLGYPECCIEFFNKVWKQGYYDPLFNIALNTNQRKEKDNIIEVNPQLATNQFLRYWGVRLTTHFPCSYHCEETVKVGKMWFNLINKIDKEVSEWMIELLTTPFEWSVYRGIAEVKHKYFYGLTNSLPTSEKLTVVVN